MMHDYGLKMSGVDLRWSNDDANQRHAHPAWMSGDLKMASNCTYVLSNFKLASIVDDEEKGKGKNG